MKRTNTKTDNGKYSAGKRILSAVLSAVLVFELSPFPQMNSFFDFSGFNLSGLIAQASNKDDVPAGTVYSAEEAYIQSLYDAESGGYILANVDDVLKYSRAYYSYPDRHEENRIIINFAGGDGTSTIPDFISIGTENNPFAGEVQFETSSNNTISIPESFFDFVLDSVKITDTDGNITPITLTRTLSDTGEPVLAKHVKHNENYTGDVVTWQIRMNQQASNSRNTAGFIGELSDDAAIQLEIVDNTSMSICGADDVGYICGKMGKRSVLIVNAFTYSSTDLDDNVVTETTSNTIYGIALLDGYTGNAGGVVGSMDEDSELTLNCSMPNVSASVESNGEDTFAGGIVG